MKKTNRKPRISPMVIEERMSPQNGIKYHLSRSKRKTAVLRVNAEGVVFFAAPSCFSLRYADQLIDLRHDWIKKQLCAFSRKIPIPVCTNEEKSLRAKQIREKAACFLSCYGGKKPKRIFVRFSKTSWGSCSSLGNISLNGYLGYLPDELFKYVLFHELSHLYYMNHSAEFWKYLSALIPDPKILRKRLSSYILPR